MGKVQQVHASGSEKKEIANPLFVSSTDMCLPQNTAELFLFIATPKEVRPILTGPQMVLQLSERNVF